MRKFKIVKKLSLDFLGVDWKECFIEFAPLTVFDVRTKFPSLSKLNEKSQDDIVKGMDSILAILKDKFLDGKGIGEKGDIVDLVAEDLESLPVEVLSRSLSFLSQSAVVPS